ARREVSVSGQPVYRPKSPSARVNCACRAIADYALISYENSGLFSGRTKNVIPQWGAHAVADMIVVVVMTQMVLLQPKPNPPLHGKVMDRVMDRVVANVAKPKPGGDSRRETAEKNSKKHPENDGKRDADPRRHHQPLGIVGIIMMNAMHNEVQSFSKTAFRFVMKCVAVDHVFEQRPDQHAE